MDLKITTFVSMTGVIAAYPTEWTIANMTAELIMKNLNMMPLILIPVLVI